MSAYTDLRDRHQKEVGDFPMFFAYNNEQFAEGMAKFGLDPNDTDKIYGFGGTGGYFLRTDSEQLHAMLDRHERERNEAITADKKGTGYIFQMFMYELANHEYGYTWDESSTLDALGLTYEDIGKNKALEHGLNKAMKKIRRKPDCFD